MKMRGRKWESNQYSDPSQLLPSSLVHVVINATKYRLYSLIGSVSVFPDQDMPLDIFVSGFCEIPLTTYLRRGPLAGSPYGLRCRRALIEYLFEMRHL